MAFISGPVPETFEREISATPAEFERDLRKAWPPGVELLAPARYGLVCGAVRLEISVEVKGVRRLGLLQLPVIAARYVFGGGEESDRRRLLDSLDRAMQRGGG